MQKYGNPVPGFFLLDSIVFHLRRHGSRFPEQRYAVSRVQAGPRLSDSREQCLFPPGKLGSSDSQIGRSCSAKLRHFLS